MSSEGSNGDPVKGKKVKATEAAERLAAMYGLDLADVPVDAGTKVTVEHVKRHLETSRGVNPEEGDVPPGAPDPGLEPSQRPDVPPEPVAPRAPVKPPTEYDEGDPVMVRGKFLGTIVGPERGGDGKPLWRVKSTSHPIDIETIAYPPEDLARAL